MAPDTEFTFFGVVSVKNVEKSKTAENSTTNSYGLATRKIGSLCKKTLKLRRKCSYRSGLPTLSHLMVTKP